ncbi:endolytic transglycosylase MltG [Candidatus Saccharibacteria bacterium]|nr:endolytic transglycosylase MltG [Candidatus Saccharibacteria bacterium]
MKVIGLDVGEKRIGIAKADSSTRIAVPAGFVEVDGSEWQKIAQVARMNNTNLFVIGLPRSNEGNETKQSMYVRSFAKKLIETIQGARFKFQDESLTSVMAEERLRSSKKKYEKGDIDAEAATIILQDFLETLNTSVAPVETPPSDVPEVKKEKKHKMKASTKWITGISVLLIIGLLTAGGIMLMQKIKDDRAAERAAEYARQEAEMKAEVFNFTIRPGETIYEVRKALIDAGYSAEEVDEALNADYDYTFLRERPAGATLEGYLYGETHEFYKTATATEVIEAFLDGMGTVIAENDLETAYAEQGLSLYEGITLASIVQSEAGSLTSEMPTVAQVFLSRLQAGMALGSDVTVSYALDTVDPDRDTYSDNQAALAVDSCYNTRINRGLPCGPISNPSLAALLAVANPSDSSYLYFLTGDDGLMYYSYTESEHNQNVYSHCQELCAVSL